MLLFLPILCLEMIPIGLMLIALDLPFLRRPVARMIAWIEWRVLSVISLWEAMRSRRRAGIERDAKSHS